MAVVWRPRAAAHGAQSCPIHPAGPHTPAQFHNGYISALPLALFRFFGLVIFITITVIMNKSGQAGLVSGCTRRRPVRESTAPAAQGQAGALTGRRTPRPGALPATGTYTVSPSGRPCQQPHAALLAAPSPPHLVPTTPPHPAPTTPPLLDLHTRRVAATSRISPTGPGRCGA
jgi:hypothetical protein